MDTDEREPTPAEHLVNLVQVVSQLAAPHSIRSRSLDRSSGNVEMVSVMHAPLIATLRDAVYGSTSGGGQAGVTEARARSVINASALEYLEALEGDIVAAWRLLIPNLAETPREWTTEESLQRWADLFLPAASGGQFEPETIAEATRLFVGWRRTILSMFVTPQVMTITKPCPLCGKARVIVGEGEEEREVWALLVSIGRTTEFHRAECRNPKCTGKWAGQEGIEQLRRDIADLEKLNAPVEGTNSPEAEHGLDNSGIPAPC